MKNHFFFLLAFTAVLFTACQNNSSTDTAAEGTPAVDTTAAAAPAADASLDGTFNVDVAASQIEWTGSKAGGAHTGTLKLQSGSFIVAQGLVAGGKFIIDMNSLTNTDQQGEDKAKLEGHLKAPDFFDVAKFPTAELGLSAGTTGSASGTLTIKGISKPITMPYTASMADGKITVETPEFSINRTDWDIKFGSGLIGTAKDRLIDDMVKLKVKLVASK